jgi:uncharacterized protein
VVSALLFGGRLAWLRTAWAKGTITPLICRETATELLAVLARKKFRLRAMEQELLLADYLPFAEIVKLSSPRAILPVACRDRDDEVFIHLAMAGDAAFLVTGDADLLALKASAPVRIVSVAELRKLIEA